MLRLALATALAGVLAAAAPAQGAIRITDARCVPDSRCQPGKPRYVAPGGKLVVGGPGVARGQTVRFLRKRGRARYVAAKLRKSRAGLLVVVPRIARSGRIRIVDRRGRRSNAYGPIHVVELPLRAPAPSGTAFDGNGMWIWQLSRSEGGDLDAIAARAGAAGVRTVFVKAGDGASQWTQFTPLLVGGLRQRGLNVCAWQFVYGKAPADEADVAIEAVRRGAQCLVIDAETDYEGRYAAAQTYMDRLMPALAPSYPVGLTSFPYVDFHPGLPYSVFFANGAGFNLPQVYWKDIGTSVDAAMQRTYVHNRIYERPIFPLGQSYDDPPPSEMTRFRQLAAAYGSSGLSWWSWQASTERGWQAIGAPIAPLGDYQPSQDYPLLRKGSKGDETLWMQEHLAAADASTPTSGVFDDATDTALRNFQAQRSLPVTATTDAATWQALLALDPVEVTWTSAQRPAFTSRSRTRRVARAPASASLPARKREKPVLGKR